MSISIDKKIMPLVFKKCSLDKDFIPFNEWLKKFSSARKIRVKNIWIKQDKKCFYCKRETVEERDMTMSYTYDHKIPVSKGGTEHPSNIVAACKSCNGMKSDLDYDYFISKVYDTQSYYEYVEDIRKKSNERKKVREENIKQGILTNYQKLFCYSLVVMHQLSIVDINDLMKMVIQYNDNIDYLNSIKRKRKRKIKRLNSELTTVLKVS